MIQMVANLRSRLSPVAGRQAGYVLISVLLALALVTTNLLIVQRTSMKSATQMSISIGLAERADVTADLVAIGGAMVLNAPPYYLEEHDLWISLQPAIGLVDLNAAHPALIESIFELHTSNTTEIMASILAARTANAPQYLSVPDALKKLQVPEGIRGTVAPFFTVATGQLSVAPDKAPDGAQAALESAMRLHDLTAEETDPTDMRRVMVATEPEGTYRPRLYVALGPSNAYRLAGHAHALSEIGLR